MSDWHTVWSRRRPTAADTQLGLRDLIDLDGFDSGAGRVTVESWRAYSQEVANELGLVEGQSVYEVGCGSGAFLVALTEAVPRIRLGGCDYAEKLIGVARLMLPRSDFVVAEAIRVPSSPRYEFVIASSVFHYFPDLEYAERVLDRMVAKSERTVAVLEVPDATRRDESEKLRRDSLPPGEYERLYDGLPHLYFDRPWFSNYATNRGLTVRATKAGIAQSLQAQFRFGVILERA